METRVALVTETEGEQHATAAWRKRLRQNTSETDREMRLEKETDMEKEIEHELDILYGYRKRLTQKSSMNMSWSQA